MAMILVYLTAGPITNITVNLQEALRVIVCQFWKIFTLTKNRFELMFSPLGEAFVKVRVSLRAEKTARMVNSNAAVSHVYSLEIRYFQRTTTLV